MLYGPAGPALAGPLFSGSLVSFPDCRDSLRTRPTGGSGARRGPTGLHRHPRVAKYACVYDVQLLAIWRTPACTDVDGIGSDVGNNSRAKRTAKILDLAIFSSKEAHSLHFSFKLGVTIQITLLSSTGPQQIKVARQSLGGG